MLKLSSKSNIFSYRFINLAKNNPKIQRFQFRLNEKETEICLVLHYNDTESEVFILPTFDISSEQNCHEELNLQDFTRKKFKKEENVQKCFEFGQINQEDSYFEYKQVYLLLPEKNKMALVSDQKKAENLLEFKEI